MVSEGERRRIIF